MKYGLYPAPVYVARFANGESLRMSFWAKDRKALSDPGRGRRLCAWAAAQGKKLPVYSAECRKEFDHGPTTVENFSIPMPVREDMIGGHVEWNGEVLPDPEFAGADVVALPKRKTAAGELAMAVKLLAELEAKFGAAFAEDFSAAQDFLLAKAA